MKARKIQQVYCSVVALCLLLMQSGCMKENFTDTTDETPNIATYLKNSEDYTLFYEALAQAGSASYLDAWGTYTVFVPTNAAMTTYLSSVGKAVSDLSTAEAKELVDRHIVQDTVSTANFRDGKIAKSSVAGLFITTAVRNVEGQSQILINREAVVVQPNQRVGNGLVHGIDKVFTLITRTVMEEIEANNQLSLFREAIVATGLDAVLNTVESDRYFSVLAVTDEAFVEEGITSLQDLLDKYSDTANPRDPNDGFYKHIAYHIVPELKYVSDFTLQASHMTKVTNEIILVKVNGERVLINEEEWLGDVEPGAEIDRSISDISAKNGVLHYLKEDIFIKERFPFPVYWDPAKQPEISAAGVYGRDNLTIARGFLKDFTWGSDIPLNYEIPTGANMLGPVHNDFLIIPMGAAPGRIPWIEFKTPVIVKGRYRVWVGWRTIDSPQGSNTLTAFVNGERLSRTLLVGEYRTRTLSDRELEAIGYKMYLSEAPASSSNNFNCKMLGIIDLEVTDRHTFRFETPDNRNTPFRLDMIHFIPIDMEQIYPQFDSNGNEVWP